MKASLKPKRCPSCKTTFTPVRSLQKVCGPLCATAWAKKLADQKAARARRDERKSLAERKAKLKTRSDWIKEAQAVVNRVARLRDILAGHGCISCGARPDARFGGAVDAGHFRSVGSAGHMRFYLPNIRLQCKKCNRDLGGSHTNYRIGLIERIGIERVEKSSPCSGQPSGISNTSSGSRR
ncbi:recombination protein NinG [Burkholderia cepacia]|uniref:recombination protein NinG n=1 Tax=Burkholderia cepacia TaxID=292 RepID=UPI00298FE405|nr:recombination protein NinG [Burkholderia cepacia]